MEEADSIRRGRPLMHAANNGHTSAVKALLECGAEPEATDDNGYTALMVAVFSDRWVYSWIVSRYSRIIWKRCMQGVHGGGVCLGGRVRLRGVEGEWAHL